MTNINPFPESEQKAYLRRYHLTNYLAPYRERIRRGLTYFGLPSAEMRDVKLWSRNLDIVTAVERDPETALRMYRTAQQLGLRRKLNLIEMDIVEAARFMSLEEQDVELHLASLSAPIARKIRKARSVGYDVLNIDMCGGFLYPNKEATESGYEQMLRHLIAYQARQQTSFILIVTFNTRDTGKSEYDIFIEQTLQFLEEAGNTTEELRQFYTQEEVSEQPPQLRRLRFCVPIYLHKIAYENFEVQGLSAWYYKTFYHTVLNFALRRGTGILGPWPPVDEMKDLLNTPLTKLTMQNGDIAFQELPSPPIE